MAYRDDITNLGADHLWAFEISNNFSDLIGSANGTGTGMNLSGTALCEDTANSQQTNAFTDRITLPTTTTINNSAQERKAVGGWYMATGFQAHPIRIYGEGDTTTNFQICMGYGNNTIFEVTEATNFPTGLQVFGIPLVPNRAYQLTAIFLGNTQGNEIKFFIDGIEQSAADPSDRQPDTANLDSRGVGEFGDPAGTTGLGGATVLQQAALNGLYNMWFAFGDEADADLTDTEIRETIFERGALAEDEITTNTEANMQTALDALTVSRTNVPLDVEINAVTGGGDFELTSDLVFDDLCSMHFRYNGTADTLTIVNVSGGNATQAKSGAPFGGTITIKTRQTLTVTVLDATTNAAVENARVYIEADSGGPETVGTVIMNATTNASGVATATYDFESSQPIIGYVRQGTSSTYYIENSIAGPLTSTALNTTILMVPDE